MHITTIALIIAILGLATSLFLFGGVISLGSLGLSIYLFTKEQSIRTVRILAISTVGVIVPIIMYLNTYGFSLPYDTGDGKGVFGTILATNYENLGFGPSGIEKPDGQALAEVALETTDSGDQQYIVHSDTGKNLEASLAEVRKREGREDTASSGDSSKDWLSTEGSIFESLDSIRQEDRNKGGIVSIAASDDNMPSYGGLPVGTLLIAQYFREDDHNCNPVLVLQNKTGGLVRYQCRFIARDAQGEEIATSDKTVEVVRDGALFVFEGRFDKRDLGGNIPDSYEFSITKREPYEEDMADQIAIYTATEGTSALLTAENKSGKKVKVDAYVLFFDGAELVDCMWMIPQNTDEVCLDPGTAATIKGDAYYRFDRVETFYTAYEAVGQG